eukprot:COSAG03_NODE_968_length_5162_cov_5.507128_2_plen_35_part_00
MGSILPGALLGLLPWRACVVWDEEHASKQGPSAL